MDFATTFTTGQSVTFDVDPERSGPARFVLGIRRSGSSLLNKIMRNLSRATGNHMVEVGDPLFHHNVMAMHWQTDPALRTILRPGNVYGGFRDMPSILIGDPLFDQGLKVLMVRDPRDALVSEYFSLAYSHAIPNPQSDQTALTALMEDLRSEALNSDLQDHVRRRTAAMRNTIMQYEPLIAAGSPTLRMFKYEDYIFRKRALIDEILTHFGWSATSEAVDAILAAHDVRPEAENPQAFIRQVAPGDHRRKLAPDTIAALNASLRPVMELLGYDAET